MKVVRFFLASSIGELKEDRAEIGDFFRQLDKSSATQQYLRFKLDRCDDFDNAISHKKKQAIYDEMIQDSDTCIFIFYKKVGEYTRHEFEVALRSFGEKQSPKIITFFKRSNEGDTDEIDEFKRYLGEELGHYYEEYTDIESVKFSILMHIRHFNLDACEVSVSDGIIKMNGHAILDIQSIPSLNTSLGELTQRKKTLQNRIMELKKALIESPTDEIIDELADTKNELSQVSSQLTTAEKETMKLASTVAESTVGGRALTYRQKEALRYFNEGDYERAIIFFQDDERENELLRAKNRVDDSLREIEGYIFDELLHIKIIKAKGINKDNIPLICEKYEGVAELVQEYGLSQEPIYEYALFLFEQGQAFYKRAIELAESVWHCYSSPDSKASPADKGRLLCLLGTLYKNTRNFDRANEAYSEALFIRISLASDGSPQSREELAEIYHNIGLLYRGRRLYDMSEKQFLNAIEIREELYKSSAEQYGSGLAYSHNALAVLLRDLGRLQECKSHLKRAIEIRELLHEKRPEIYKAVLATSYNGLAVLYREAKEYRSSEVMFLLAIEMRESLYEENPNAYEYDLSTSNNGLGVLYGRMGRYEEGERRLLSAISARKMMCKTNATTCKHELALSYTSIADLYIAWGKPNQGRHYYILALDIYKELNDLQGELFKKEIKHIEDALSSIE
ncbi:MAG: tetratricopeptide repeat protein [Clostridia bacterium]|nr:tetratricopeptide repeat protein [Clostridia bacterium]